MTDELMHCIAVTCSQPKANRACRECSQATKSVQNSIHGIAQADTKEDSPYRLSMAFIKASTSTCSGKDLRINQPACILQKPVLTVWLETSDRA